MTTCETEMQAEILADWVSEVDVDRACKCLEQFTYTASMLRALARVYGAVDGFADAEGAELLERFAREFAAYEATVV